MALALAAGWHQRWCLPPWVLSKTNPSSKYSFRTCSGLGQCRCSLLGGKGDMLTFSVLQAWAVSTFACLVLLAMSSSCPHTSSCAACQRPDHQISPLWFYLTFIGSSWMLHMEPDVRPGDHLKGQVISSICLCPLILTGGHTDQWPGSWEAAAFSTLNEAKAKGEPYLAWNATICVCVWACAWTCTCVQTWVWM